MKTIEKVENGYRVTEGNEINLLSDAELVKFIKDEGQFYVPGQAG